MIGILFRHLLHTYLGESEGTYILGPQAQKVKPAKSWADREVAQFVHHQERGEDQGLEALAEAARGPGLFQRGDRVGQGAVVDPATALRGGDVRCLLLPYSQTGPPEALRCGCGASNVTGGLTHSAPAVHFTVLLP